MKKIYLAFIIILLIFSCKTAGDKKSVPVKNSFLEYRAMGNGFADVSFLLYKDSSFKINILVLSDKSKAVLDGSWQIKNGKLVLYFAKKLPRADIENIFDLEHNKGKNIPVDIMPNSAAIPQNAEYLWMFNVLCKRK
jgi:hypothetical protein